MPVLDIDQEVFDFLAKNAKPFEDRTPNDVLRRLLGLPVKSTVNKLESAFPPMVTKSVKPAETTSPKRPFTLHQHRLDKLREAAPQVDGGFLTFLMDKHLGTEGNFHSRQILPFIQQFNLQMPDGELVNPWKAQPYRSKASLLATVAHFRECRQFGCWGGRGYKTKCQNIVCRYHPKSKSPEGPASNKCDLRKGVIWKRASPEKPYFYGEYYLDAAKEELLKGQALPLELLVAVFYPEQDSNPGLIGRFCSDFHFSDRELNYLFS